MNGISFDTVTNDWAISLEAAGGVVGHAPTAEEALQRFHSEMARYVRIGAIEASPLASEELVAVSSPRVTNSPRMVTKRQGEAPLRCAWFSAIRRFYGCAQGAALDTKAEDAMRAALSAFLGRTINTRRELSAGDWLLAGDAVKFGRLVW
jgi:hypothetical protein